MPLRVVLMGAMLLVLVFSSVNFYQNVIKYKTVTAETVSTEERKKEDSWPELREVRPGGEILQKNIFSPDRGFQKDTEETGAPEEPVVTVMPELTLKGIVLNQYNEYVAYISKDRDRTVAAREGDRIDDLKVTGITEREVTLEWKGRRITLSLRTTPRTD